MRNTKENVFDEHSTIFNFCKKRKKGEYIFEQKLINVHYEIHLNSNLYRDLLIVCRSIYMKYYLKLKLNFAENNE